MKRPYREGSRFVVPLGDGRCTIGLIARGTRKVLQLAFFSPELVCVRASDRALRDARWPVVGSLPGFARDDWPAPGRDDILTPGIVERMLAAQLSGTPFAPPRRCVYDVGGVADLENLPDGDVRVQWRRALDADALSRVEAAVRRRHAHVRLYGSAAAQAGTLAAWDLESLALEAPAVPASLPPFSTVRELALDGVPAHLAALLGAFPALRTLRIRARGSRFDAAALAGSQTIGGLDVYGAVLTNAARLRNLPSLRAIDVRDSIVDDIGAVAQLPVRALRLARVPGVRSLAALAHHPSLRVLALEGLTAFDDAATIDTLSLESLDLRGLWQFGVNDVAFVASMPGLRRLRLDIGGRRKNAEIYRRRLFAEPLPFDVEDMAARSGIRE